MKEVTTHACRKCEQELPATTEFFYRAGQHFNWICKPCMIAYVKGWGRERYGRPGFHERECEHCGGTWLSPRRDARHCCIECHVAARHLAEKVARLARKCANPRSCARCGQLIDPSRSMQAKFCTTRCAEQAHKQTRKFRRRDGISTRRGADEPLISLVYFAERDGRRCGLCHTAVDMRLSHPDPFCPSLDHIVPLACGGTNDPANLQLAHLRCNLSKRDRPRDEQLRLIG